MDQSRGGYGNHRGGARGGRGGRGGARGGYHNNNNNNRDDHQANNAPQQAPKETPDHSPIGDIEGLIARLGDTYLTLDDPTQVNLYNNYNHQFDIYLPDHPTLEPFYNESVPLHIQIRKIGDEVKQLLSTSAVINKGNKIDETIIERVIRTIFRAITAFPTKVSIYAAFVAHLGIDHAQFLTLVLNETYKQLEASIKGLMMVMLLDLRKDNLNIHGSGKSKSLLQLLSTLTLSITPTTTISAPAIHYEALMRFLSTLVGYGCVPYDVWTNILNALRSLCSITTTPPSDGDWDSIRSTLYDGNDATTGISHVALFLPDALPFELSSVQSVIEKLSQNASSISASSSVVSSVMDESILSATTPDNDESNPTANQHHTASQHRTNKVNPGKVTIVFTAFTDVIVHGLLSALTFAARDVLNFGTGYNTTQHGNIPKLTQLTAPNQHGINSDSILFNLATNWYNNLESRSPEDVDVELEYDFQSQSNPVLLHGISSTNGLQDVTIDGITFKVTQAEHFFISMFKSISHYLFYRNQAFGQQIKPDSCTEINGLIAAKPPTLFNSSTFLTDSANTFQFFSQPELFQDDKVNAFAPMENTNPNDKYFDYLTWAYFSVTGSLPDGTIHIVRSLQDPTSPHSWGLINRPFSIATPVSRHFKQQVRQSYINQANAIAEGLIAVKTTGKQSEVYTFNLPKLQEKASLYIIPSVDNALTQLTNAAPGGSKVVKKRAGATVLLSAQASSATSAPSDSIKMSNKLADYLSPTQQDLLASYSKAIPPSSQKLPYLFVTQPAAFPPILSLLPQRAQPAAPSDQPKDTLTNLNNPAQARYTMVPNANNVDVWLTYSYLFYSNLTYYGLQEEYNSLLSSLPPLFPIWGYSQSPLYLADGAPYRKYARCFAPTSRQSAVTQSTVSTIVAFFFAMIMSNTNNFIEPLTPIETFSGDSVTSPFLHNNLTSNEKSYFVSTLIRFMYEHPTKVPSSLGPRFFQLFKQVHYLSLTSRQNLAVWFSEHLCQFNFMFPWNHFAFLNTLNDPTHIQHVFISSVLSRCVKLTSFSVVAANVRQLWLLLPTIQPLLNHLKPQTYHPTPSSSLDNVSLMSPHSTASPSSGPVTDVEQKILVAPTITTSPTLNEPLLILSTALSNHVHKSIILTTLYFAPGVFNSSLISQFQQLLYTIQPLEIAQQYVIDPENPIPDAKNLSFISVQQAATWAIDPSRVNIFACYLWVAMLTAAKSTNTHFQYFLTNYGDILAILSNSSHTDLLHTGFHNMTNIGSMGSLGDDDDDDGDQGIVVSATSTIPGYNPYSKEYETIDPSQYPKLIQNVITNSNYVAQSPGFPSSMLYNNGFVLCPLLDQNGQIVTPSRTVITALPNPTQLVLLDLLLLFYNNELSHIKIKLQYIIQFNLVSVPTVLVWLLFYLPRHQHVKSTVFNPMLMELLFLVIDLYLMANNERENKFLDLFKVTFATISTTTATVPNTITMGEATEATESTESEPSAVATTTTTIFQDEITPALLDKVSKIKQQQDKITSYKVNFFSTIFSLMYDWVADWPTVLIVLKTQAYARNEAFQASLQTDDVDGDDEEAEERRLKRQRLAESQASVETQLNNSTLIYQDDECIVKHVCSAIIALLTRYKVDVRNISKDIVDQCNIPGLEGMIKQVFQ